MIKIAISATAMMFMVTPLASAEAQDRPTLATSNEAQNAAQATPPAGVATRPVDTARPDDNSRPPNWRRINHKINKRAKNAIENGADPARVRHKVQVYKHKLIRRWKASQ